MGKCEDFGKKIYDLRKNLGMSAKELGKQIGVNGGSICNWENCKYVMSRESYGLLTARFPELADFEYEDLIVIETKPGGSPHNPSNGRKKGDQISPPVRPKVFTKKKSSEPDEDSVETVMVTVPLDWIRNVAANMSLMDRLIREEFILSLRKSNVSDTEILNILNEAL